MPKSGAGQRSVPQNCALWNDGRFSSFDFRKRSLDVRSADGAPVHTRATADAYVQAQRFVGVERAERMNPAGGRYHVFVDVPAAAAERMIGTSALPQPAGREFGLGTRSIVDDGEVAPARILDTLRELSFDAVAHRLVDVQTGQRGREPAQYGHHDAARARVNTTERLGVDDGSTRFEPDREHAILPGDAPLKAPIELGLDPKIHLLPQMERRLSLVYPKPARPRES